MPSPCVQVHVIHLWYCQVPKYSKNWCIFRQYVATVLCYSTDISNQLMAFLLSELKSWWITATQGSLSTGDYAFSVSRVTSVKAQLFWIPGQNILRENTRSSGGASQCTWWAICCNSKTSQRMHQRNAGWQRSNMASKLLFLCHKSDRIAASQRPLWTFSGHRTVCHEKARP